MKSWHDKPGLLFTLVVVLALAVCPLVSKRADLREVVFTVLLFVALASSLNLILGYAGYVSFGHVVYFGLGGYVGFYLLAVRGQSLWVALLGGGAASALLAFLLGKAILRLRGGYFALATIGVNEAVRAFVSNFEPFGGPIGMSLGFDVFDHYGGAGEALWLTYYTLVMLVVAVLCTSYSVKNSKFGLGLLALREDEDAAEAMGVDAPLAKTRAYVLSALFPGILGALFFFKNGTIEPATAFRLQMSIEMIVMVMLGGYGTVLGPVLGAAGYQGLRGFLLTSAVFKNIQLAIAGALLLVIVLFVPAGAVGLLRRRVPALRRLLP